ncbi:MAG TPA: hypothetical protein VK964_00880 [Nocardioidaceae bacterium]|nr:hypothetical protein [Nocardioidaceae bacterium]
MGDVLADAGALDRPNPVRPLLAAPQHRWVAVAVVPNRPPPVTVSSAVITSIVAERLCGSIPMTTRSGRNESDSPRLNRSLAGPGRGSEAMKPAAELRTFRSRALVNGSASSTS